MTQQSLKSLINLLYPNLCVACGRELVEGESQICTFCRWEMPLTGYHIRAENYVVELFAGRVEFENASSLLYFRNGSDNFRHLIHRMKYSSRRDIAYLMGEIMGAKLMESELYQTVDLLIPIPLHWTRRIQRGYNQAEELCRGISVSMNIPYNSKVVKRSRITQRQAFKPRDERWKNVSGAFSVNKRILRDLKTYGDETQGNSDSLDFITANSQSKDSATKGLLTDNKRLPDLRGKHILLVDDVLTSGATIEACADIILRYIPDVKLSIATLAVAERVRQKGVSQSLN